MTTDIKHTELRGFKGTHGPWTVERYGDGDSLVIHAGEDWRICFMATPGSSHGAMAKIVANAKLIASSYAMAVFVQRMREWLTGDDLRCPIYLDSAEFGADKQRFADEARALLSQIGVEQ